MATQVMTVQLQPISDFYPSHTKGDQELFGNPKTHLEVVLHTRGQQLTLYFYISFMEVGGDHTSFQGADERVLFDTDIAFPGWTLDTIIGQPAMQFSWDGRPEGYGTHFYYAGDSGLVRDFTLQADEWSVLSADRPGIISLNFNPVRIQLSKADTVYARSMLGPIRDGKPLTEGDVKKVLAALKARKPEKEIAKELKIPKWTDLKPIQALPPAHMGRIPPP